MKIGLVCPYNLFKGGGVQECVWATYAELTKRGHDVRIITPRPRGVSEPPNEHVLFVGNGADVKTVFHTTAQVSVALRNEVIDELLQREAFDVLHFHEPWISIVSRQILSRSTARNIATFHAKLPGTVMSRTLEKVAAPYMKAILKHLDELTAVSDAAAEYVRSITHAPVRIIPNGIDVAKYGGYKPKKTSQAETILYIGRLERRKGLKYLLRATRELQRSHPKARLLLAGDGTDRRELENYSQEIGVKVQFLGFVDEQTKLELFKTSSVFCSPARYGESFGIVLLEAMSSGLPLVAGDNSGYSGVLTGTGKISLLDPRDTSEFVRKLELMMYDEEVRKVWLKWALKEVKQYDYPKVVDQYLELYGKT